MDKNNTTKLIFDLAKAILMVLASYFGGRGLASVLLLAPSFL